MVAGRESVCLIGGGRLGAPLGYQLNRCGQALLAIVEENPSRRAQLKQWFAESLIQEECSNETLQSASLIILAVQDDRIEPLAAHLAHQPVRWSGKLVWHCSGALTSGVLSPLADRGACTLSVHPLLAFSATSPQAISFRGVYFDVEGNQGGLARTRRVLESLGAQVWPVDGQQKPALHLAAVLLSNHLVTLAHLARRVLQQAGVPEPFTWKPFRPLLEQTMRNLDTQPPEQALTGPLARGDLKALAAHLDFLQNNLPELLPVYRALNHLALVFAPLNEAEKESVRKLLDRYARQA